MKLIVLSLAILAFTTSAVHAQDDAVEYDAATDEFLAGDLTDEAEADVEAEADAQDGRRRGNTPAGQNRPFCGRALSRRFGGSKSKLCAKKGMRRACPQTCPKKSAPKKSAPLPRCAYYPRARTVYVFCNGKPVKKWGIGPEGRSRATGNCNHAYRRLRRGGPKFCQGKGNEVEADIEAEADAQEDVEAGRTLTINMKKYHCGHRKGEKAGNCRRHDCRWQCERGHRASAWCGSFKWNQRRYLCSLKSAPVPTCKYYPRARTVYVYCNGKPVKKWGIGPEGRSQAARNCYHAYHNHRRGGLKFCKGK